MEKDKGIMSITSLKIKDYDNKILGSWDSRNSIMAPTIDMSPESVLGRNLEDLIYEKIMAKFSRVPIVRHKCNSCGAELEISADKHIFYCKYCKSVYAIGTQMINDLGKE